VLNHLKERAGVVAATCGLSRFFAGQPAQQSDESESNEGPEVDVSSPTESGCDDDDADYADDADDDDDDDDDDADYDDDDSSSE
jgi:hypothetical protein